MERLTTNDENHILASLNLFYCKDNEVWIRGGGPEPDYADCTLVDWIVSAAEKHHLDIFSRDAEGLGEEMYDSMQFGSDTIEGIVALLHAAAIQAAEMQGHLAAIEDILGDEYDLDELREMAQAKRKGRCVVLPCKKGDTVWRIVHDATPHITKDRCTDIKYENRDIWVHLIGDRVMGGWNFGKLLFLTREEAQAALRREQDG